MVLVSLFHPRMPGRGRPPARGPLIDCSRTRRPPYPPCDKSVEIHSKGCSAHTRPDGGVIDVVAVGTGADRVRTFIPPDFPLPVRSSHPVNPRARSVSAAPGRAASRAVPRGRRSAARPAHPAGR
ncbi:hypothetical protein SGPA1_21782 [Streptomyces misionensis JCM 4497]